MRKKKITIQEIPDYYSYRRISSKGGYKCGGYAYLLCDRLSEEEITYLLSHYQNTYLVLSSNEYAPEIKHDVLIVFDKCIR